MGGPEKDRCAYSVLLGTSVLCHRLCTLRHCVFSQLSWKQQADRGLNFPGGNGGPPVVKSQTRRFGRAALKDVIHEGVHDAHGLRRNSSVRMHLLQDFVHIDGVTFLSVLPSRLSGCRDLGEGLLRALLRHFTVIRHVNISLISLISDRTWGSQALYIYEA